MLTWALLGTPSQQPMVGCRWFQKQRQQRKSRESSKAANPQATSGSGELGPLEMFKSSIFFERRHAHGRTFLPQFFRQSAILAFPLLSFPLKSTVVIPP